MPPGRWCSDRGAQYTSWVFGHRLREAGLLRSMGRVASSVDNSMMESFWSTLQRELLDTRRWATRSDLAGAIFEWIQAWYNPSAGTRCSTTDPRSSTNASHRRPTRGIITTPKSSGEPVTGH